MPEDLNLHPTDHLVDTSGLIVTTVRPANGAILHQACRLLLTRNTTPTPLFLLLKQTAL